MHNFKIGDWVLVNEKENQNRLGIVDEYDGNNYIEINFDDGESKAVRVIHCTKVEEKDSHYLPNRQLIFFNTEEEYKNYCLINYGSSDIGEWSQEWNLSKCPELCVLKFINDEFKIYEGRGQGSIVAVTEKRTYQSKDGIFTTEFLILGPYYGGEKFAYLPYVR
jgi:hypothetical protein